MNDSYGKWIPVTERLPEEYDSMFKKYKGTYEWKPFMFEKHSKTVLVTIKYSDGEMHVETAKTIEGQWSINAGVIIAWMPLPEPYIEGENNPITNADVIRNMTDEELDEFLGDRCPFSCREVCEKYQHGCWEKCWTKNEELRLKWLKSENKRRL